MERSLTPGFSFTFLLGASIKEELDLRSQQKNEGKMNSVLTARSFNNLRKRMKDLPAVNNFPHNQ